LLTEFVGVTPPLSSLYGRNIKELKSTSFYRQTSISFLKAGFEENGLSFLPERLEDVVDRLDGIVGWLTLCGSRSIEAKRLDNRIKASVLNMAT
jgi:AAA+ ATPase superfamily predicted ATPase